MSEECEIIERIVGNEDRLPSDHDDSSSQDQVARDELKSKHEDAIRSFNTCIQRSKKT